MILLPLILSRYNRRLYSSMPHSGDIPELQQPRYDTRSIAHSDLTRYAREPCRNHSRCNKPPPEPPQREPGKPTGSTRRSPSHLWQRARRRRRRGAAVPVGIPQRPPPFRLLTAPAPRPPPPLPSGPRGPAPRARRSRDASPPPPNRGSRGASSALPIG